MKEQSTDILVVGGGMGGVAAALAAARLGKNVLMTEETRWIGGQITAQGVPADEHKWIEMTGCTQSYRELRNRIRDYYRTNYPMLPSSRNDPFLNPGMGFVSRICCEPRVVQSAMFDMLAPYRSIGQIQILFETQPVAVEMDGDRVTSVTLEDRNGEKTTVQASYVLDATELGDLLHLGNIEYVIGAESQNETGELHALEGEANPLDQQSITWCFAIDYIPGGNFTIPKPEDYDFWESYRADFWPSPQLSWNVSEAMTHKPLYRPLMSGPREAPVAHDLWHFRRILYAGHFPEGTFPSDIVLLNVAALDYWLKPLVGVSERERQEALRGAMQLSYSFLHWIQTEAPRHDGGYGYPEVRLRGDVFDTDHGLAMYPYIRESRRIKAEFTVFEQHVGVEARPGLESAEKFVDSVGIGAYRLDLHPSTAPRDYIDIDSWPLQIPLGSLIPQRVENLLPACKNIGTTHITNGAYRVHPIEWNIGEAAGALAAFCLDRELVPRQVRNSQDKMEDFQQLLTSKFHILLEWPIIHRITRDMRYGSPSAIFGGSWLSETAIGGWQVSPQLPKDEAHPG
jgi:FAD dependent oxidoreductase